MYLAQARYIRAPHAGRSEAIGDTWHNLGDITMFKDTSLQATYPSSSLHAVRLRPSV